VKKKSGGIGHPLIVPEDGIVDFKPRLAIRQGQVEKWRL
jgi:hypothetical protein